MTDKHIPASKLVALKDYWDERMGCMTVRSDDLRALIDAETESVEPVWIVSRDNKGRTTNIIPGHPTKFDIGKLPDGTPLYTAPPSDNLIVELVEALEDANEALREGIESEMELEAEHSKYARVLCKNIDALLKRAKEVM